MQLARRVEIWTTRRSAGGTRLGILPDDLTVVEQRSVEGEERLTLSLPATSSAASSLLERRVLALDYDDTPTYDEWRISGITDRRTPDGELLLDVEAVPLLYDLAEECLVVRTEADGTVVYDFEALALTPTEIINAFILPALTAEGITDLALGTVDPTIPVDLVFAWDTPLSALRRLAQVAGAELQLRRNGTTQYLIDLRTQIGSGATALDLRFGKNLPWLNRPRQTEDFATRVAPQGAVEEFLHATMAGARWTVTNVAGTTLTLADPAGGDGPLAFDDQLNGCYLRRVSGTLTQVNDSTASAQQVVVADATGIATGDLIEFRKDSSGTALTHLENPAGKSTYGRRVQALARADLPSTINLVGNPAMRDYASASAPPDTWGLVRGATLTRTSTGARWKTGGYSCRVQGSADGDGLETGYAALSPSATKPYFSGFLTFWIETGRLRVELIAAKTALSVSSLTRSGSVVTVTTTGNHGLAVGQLVEILGATQTDYNGIVAVVSVPSATTFTYAIATTPTTPATGTITAAQVWRLPNGTDGLAYSDQTKVWVDLGPAGIDLNALGATRAKLRLVQDGSTALDAYVDSAQLTQSAGQLAFIAGAGPTLLWQAANAWLLDHAQPAIRYEAAWIDLKQLAPETWGYEDLTLGGAVNIRDEALGITATTRLLGYQRNVRVPDLVSLVLSNRPNEFTDQVLKPRLPPRHERRAAVERTLLASAEIIPVPATPGAVQARLAANVPGATLYYWLGDVGEVPPPVSTVQAGVPSSTAWGTYTTAFTVNRDQSVDLVLHVFARLGNARSDVVPVTIDRDTAPSATLTLSEPAGGTLRYAFTHDDDTAWLVVYRLANGGGSGWPTTDHTDTGPLDPATFWARIHVAADGGGFDQTGGAIAGGAIPDETGYAGGDSVKVILIPIDRLGNAGARVTATRTMAGTPSPSISAASASRTNDGSACDTTNGAEYTFNWTLANASDAGHDVEVAAIVASDMEYTATEVSPVTNTSATVRIPFKKTTGKFDGTVSVACVVRLKDSGGTVIDEVTVRGDEFKSSCVIA